MLRSFVTPGKSPTPKAASTSRPINGVVKQRFWCNHRPVYSVRKPASPFGGASPRSSAS
jgi:ribosomal protein L34E